MRARAMVMKAYRQPLALEEVAIPKLEPSDILVKIDASGVCGSDVHAWLGEDPRVVPPIILGHEGIGTIVEIGKNHKSVNDEPLNAGDRILWNRGIACGRCYHCKVMKQPALCSHRQVYGMTMAYTDSPYLTGCYADYIILRAGTDMFKVPAAVDPAVLVAASCSGATASHAFDMLRPGIGDTVLIQGSGPLAMFSVMLAKVSGAQEIMVIGSAGKRFDICRLLGATRLYSIQDTTAAERNEHIQDITKGRGADFVVEAVGRPAALREALNYVKTGGTLLSMGFGQPMGTIEFDGFHDLVRKNLRIQGVWVSDTTHTHQAIQLILANLDAFSQLITHRFSLTDADQALAMMRSEAAAKAVLIPLEMAYA